MTAYNAYCLGWQACLDGVDGRYSFMMPRRVWEAGAMLQQCWRRGWEDAFNRENDDDAPLPESELDLS